MLMEWKTIVKIYMSILLKVIFQVQCNSYQNPNGIFHRNRKKTILKFVWSHKRLNSQSNIETEQN